MWQQKKTEVLASILRRDNKNLKVKNIELSDRQTDGACHLSHAGNTWARSGSVQKMPSVLDLVFQKRESSACRKSGSCLPLVNRQLLNSWAVFKYL